ncbi:hypothetical protein AAFC00_001860 [Neodothiora populina]|uniref:NECAP PHear domain-containing protein n=1 Tax=Neodothiora populina TaxID=2781224 RepID=A0ABR3PQD9_9PEZI
MTTIDPATGQSLSESAIQRVLFVCPRVHVYQIPPLTSTKGFTATSWTAPPRPTAQQIFTARVRIIETSLNSTIKADIVLEDPSTGDLFAAAPYTAPAVLQQALDSSRFFAVRVVGEGGMKATLGMGFEERSDAFDFSITLSEVRKVLGMDPASTSGQRAGSSASGSDAGDQPKQDFSLKEGESITVNIGGRGRRIREEKRDEEEDGAALFSLKPPPPPGQDAAFASLAPPPPPARATANRTPSPAAAQPSAQDLGFDDGEFGEFQ